MLAPRRWLGLVVAAVCVAFVLGVAVDHHFCRPIAEEVDDAPEQPSPDVALAELRRGNERFRASHRTRSIDTAHDGDDRRRLARGQHPFAAVLCCSDSRVCPEFIFDQRSGAIFEIRNAGNVVDDDVMASLEYAVEHLHVPLVLVLGHKGCGAVGAVCEAGDRPLHDHLRALQDHMKGIRPDVLRAHGAHGPELIERLARENARQQALDLLRESDPLRVAIERCEVRLFAGLYDMETGDVEFFDPR